MAVLSAIEVSFHESEVDEVPAEHRDVVVEFGETIVHFRLGERFVGGDDLVANPT
jgi:hypothetical protein